MSIAEIESVFRDDQLRFAPDLKHSDAEVRKLAVGKTASGRYAFVVFTLREGKLRVVSAGYMHAKERKKYGV